MGKKARNEYRLHMCRIAGIGKRVRYGRVNPVIRQNKNQLSLLDSIPGASPHHVHSAKPNISPRGRKISCAFLTILVNMIQQVSALVNQGKTGD
jgi:hypothetical protein